MKIGSKVKTVADFYSLSNIWGLPYPKMGEILTVCRMQKHPNSAANSILLGFEEKPDLPLVCEKQYDGTINFIEVDMDRLSCGDLCYYEAMDQLIIVLAPDYTGYVMVVYSDEFSVTILKETNLTLISKGEFKHN